MRRRKNPNSPDRLFLLTDSPSKDKLGKVYEALIILFYASPSSPSLQSRLKDNAKILSKNSTIQESITIWRQNLLFLLKTQTHTHTHTHKDFSSASYWWKNTKSSFKENVRTFSKNSTTLENIKISRLKEDCKIIRELQARK